MSGMYLSHLAVFISYFLRTLVLNKNRQEVRYKATRMERP